MFITLLQHAPFITGLMEVAGDKSALSISLAPIVPLSYVGGANKYMGCAVVQQNVKEVNSILVTAIVKQLDQHSLIFVA
jgi:hypothetical protein